MFPINILLKTAGGPGSGSSENNTKEIKDIPKSTHVSVGTRKALLNNMPFTEEVIDMSKITHVGQSKFVPNKLRKMIKNWKFMKDKPIEVLKVGNEYHVIDGHHRYLAAKQLGEKTIKANVYVKREEKTADLKKVFDDYFAPVLKGKLDKLKDRKGEFELDLSGFAGDGFEKTYKFLENIKSADSIGCKVDDEKIFDWKGCEIIPSYRKPRMSNPNPNDIQHITVKGGAKEIGILKTLFKEISKINTGTSGNFYINGKSQYSLDGDGADRVALKIKCDLPEEKTAAIINLYDKYRKENKVKTSDFDALIHNFKNNILIDLDNVIHDMNKYDDNKIDGKPVEGAKEWIDKLRDKGKRIYILSARSCRNFDSKKELIEKWLDKYEIYYDEVVDKKIPASVFIDDRAIAFHGDWEDAYNEAVNFNPVQDQKGDDKLLKHTKWLELRSKNGFIYSHEVSCGGQKVAILPYRRVGKDGHEVLLREELNYAWSKDPVLSSITGGVELGEDKRSAARRELLEETGFGVRSADLRYVGYCYGSKMSDSIYHLFTVDVTGMKSTLPKGDGSELEDKAKNKFWKWDTEARRECKDPLVAMMISRMTDSDIELTYKFSPIYYQLGLDKIPEHKIPLVEELSEVVHNQWMDLARGVLATEKISDKRRKRWESYMVPYEKLNKSNKEKDRVWARKYLLAAKNVADKKASWMDSYSEEELNTIKEAGIVSGVVNAVKPIQGFVKNLPNNVTSEVVKNGILPNGIGDAFGKMGISEVKQIGQAAKAQVGVTMQNANKVLENKQLNVSNFTNRGVNKANKMIAGTGVFNRKVASVHMTDSGKWVVYSEDGKPLSKEMSSEDEARNRLRMIEYFKHKKVDKNQQ